MKKYLQKIKSSFLFRKQTQKEPRRRRVAATAAREAYEEKTLKAMLDSQIFQGQF